MTEKYLKSLLDKLNKHKTNGLIFLRPLSESVDFAKVWTEKPKPTEEISNSGPYDFYFIKNNDGVYVATVLDMYRDLHWFVFPSFRGQGHLSIALKNTILFHLFRDRDEQRITIDIHAIGPTNFKQSENVALRLGFKKTNSGNDSEYMIFKDQFQSLNDIEGNNTIISEERIEELKKQINYISRSLWLVQTECEMSFGESEYFEELKELVKEIKRHTWRLEDYWYETKNALRK